MNNKSWLSNAVILLGILFLGSMVFMQWLSMQGSSIQQLSIQWLLPWMNLIVLIFVGIAFAGLYLLRPFPDSLKIVKALPVVLFTLLLIEILHFSLVDVVLQLNETTQARIITELIRYIIFVALLEELWFRGVFFEYLTRHFKHSKQLPIVITSLGFALFHFHQGIFAVTTTFALGYLWATLRSIGIPLWLLVLQHGVMDWINMALFTTATERFNSVIVASGFVVGILLISLTIQLLTNRIELHTQLCSRSS